VIFGDSDLRDNELMDFLAQQESVDVGWGTDFGSDFEREMREGTKIHGDRLPWEDFHDKIGFPPGQVTLHAGMNKHRKSMVTGQLMGWFALQGARVGIMSFEMPISVTMRRLCCQMAGSKDPGEKFWREWLAWNDKRICYYDKFDSTPVDRVLAACLYMGRDLGCRHIVIDSLTKCKLPYGEGGPVKEFIDILTDTARALNVHIHLVCHVRKPDSQGDAYIPNRYDIRGAGELSDLAHNVIIHWANLKKARILQRGTGPKNDTEEKILDKPCQLFIVDKQRNGPFDGPIGLTHHESMQFHRGRLLRPNLHMEAAA